MSDNDEEVWAEICKKTETKFKGTEKCDCVERNRKQKDIKIQDNEKSKMSINAKTPAGKWGFGEVETGSDVDLVPDCNAQCLQDFLAMCVCLVMK